MKYIKIGDKVINLNNINFIIQKDKAYYINVDRYEIAITEDEYKKILKILGENYHEF